VTGFVVSSEEEAAAAVVRAAALDRGVIRGAFERRFAASVMAARYIDVYRRLSDAWELGKAVAAVSRRRRATSPRRGLPMPVGLPPAARAIGPR
jgi:hypothetical protein